MIQQEHRDLFDSLLAPMLSGTRRRGRTQLHRAVPAALCHQAAGQFWGFAAFLPDSERNHGAIPVPISTAPLAGLGHVPGRRRLQRGSVPQPQPPPAPLMPCSHPAPAPGPFLTAERFLFLPRPRGTQRGWGRGRIAPLLGALRGRGTAQGTPAPLPLPWRCRSAAEIQQHPHRWPGSAKNKTSNGSETRGRRQGASQAPPALGRCSPGGRCLPSH